jgi:hypothetical protein
MNSILAADLARQPHALLADACRCHSQGLCMTCRRWSRHADTVATRRAAWASYSEGRG